MAELTEEEKKGVSGERFRKSSEGTGKGCCGSCKKSEGRDRRGGREKSGTGKSCCGSRGGSCAGEKV